jgi:hypothetical protein
MIAPTNICSFPHDVLNVICHCIAGMALATALASALASSAAERYNIGGSHPLYLPCHLE